MNRLNLLAQLFGHGRAIGLVLGINVVSKRRAFCVEYNDQLVIRVVSLQTLNHPNDAFSSACIKALAIGQRGEGVKRSK